MLIFFASGLAKLYPEHCSSPVDHAPSPGENFTLLHVSVVTRHGNRAPYPLFLPRDQRGNWVCDNESAITPRTQSSPQIRYGYESQYIRPNNLEYPPSCQAGDLTVDGQQQHLALGESYRRYLVDELHFLPEKFDPAFFFFTNTPRDRCLRSAMSFISGLYPAIDPNEVINIISGDNSVYPLVLPDKTCPEFKKCVSEYWNRPEVEEFLNSIWDNVSVAMAALELQKTYDNVHKLCSWVSAFGCGDVPHPQFLDENLMKVCQRVNVFNQGDLYDYCPRGMAAARQLRYIMNEADAALLNGQKFSLFSGQDTTVGAILRFLGQKDDHVPRYAAHLTMELWRKDDMSEIYVRFSYNGNPVTIVDFNESLVPFHDFRQIAMELISNYCQ